MTYFYFIFIHFLTLSTDVCFEELNLLTQFPQSGSSVCLKNYRIQQSIEACEPSVVQCHYIVLTYAYITYIGHFKKIYKYLVIKLSFNFGKILYIC